MPGVIQTVKISPDGKQFAAIVFETPKDAASAVHRVVQDDLAGIFVANADGAVQQWNPNLDRVQDIAWSPDSTSLVSKSVGPSPGHHSIKSQLDISTSGAGRQVLSLDNVIGGIAWTAKGQEIAFTSTETSVLTSDTLYTIWAGGGGTPKKCTPDLAGSVMGIEPDGNGNLWVAVNRGVQSEVDRYAGGKLEPTFRWPNGYVGGTPVFCNLDSARPQLVFSVGDPNRCANLAIPAKDDRLLLSTQDGDSELSGVMLGDVKVVHWKSKEGVALEGIVTFPPSFVSGKRYPLVVMPHGGPESNDLLSLFGDARYLAGMGYVVIQPEYRGSTGYGSAFLGAIYQHFGDRAFRDVDSAADFAIAQGWADPNRLAMFGWSAGGFMTAWTITQTHRYRAAVEGAGITDWGSFMWTSDNAQFDFDARLPDKDPKAFERFSPVMFADNVTTPLLILHGEADDRIPIYQGREYFEELSAKGKTVRMVTYPGSGHFPSLWEQRQDVYRELGAWLKSYDP